MQPVSFKRPKFPPDVIRLAIRPYFQFSLNFRDVEEKLAERCIDTSYETVRCWSLKFGGIFAHNLRRKRLKPSGRWHLVIRQRERRLQKVKSQASARRLLATHATVYNNFNVQRHLFPRSTLRLFRADVDRTWAAATAAA